LLAAGADGPVRPRGSALLIRETDMKLKTLSAACALALGGMATQAQAVTPFEAADVTVMLSGATAPDNFIASIAIALFEGTEGNNAGWWRFRDDAGTPGVFTDDGRLFNAYFGRVKNTADIPTALRGRKVMFIKRSKGGSVWGVNPDRNTSQTSVYRTLRRTCSRRPITSSSGSTS
jgi:hypothetical protein